MDNQEGWNNLEPLGYPQGREAFDCKSKSKLTMRHIAAPRVVANSSNRKMEIRSREGWNLISGTQYFTKKLKSRTMVRKVRKKRAGVYKS